MKVTIDLRLYATLQQYSPPDASQFTIESGSDVQAIVQHLDIPMKYAKLIFIDGIKKELDTRLNGGERVAIFPPIGGG